ncbi:MAG: adenosylcobinamide-GDP ribazoletransferase [Cyanobacteria bacterium J06643_4]
MKRAKKRMTLLAQAWASWLGAIIFYTCLPLPQHWHMEFRWIARWAPWVGALIGLILGLSDGWLGLGGMPLLVRSALIVAMGLLLTGGLHADGVADSADGLAVPDASGQETHRRLEVMADSRMGAFGGMAVVVLILLKVLALGAIEDYRLFVLVGVSMWGRWAQQWAIARYPYLKKDGKGAFHKAALPTLGHTVPCLLGLLGIQTLWIALGWISLPLGSLMIAGGVVLSLLTSAYFNWQLGGHTGDTYGAVVEWTEALLLCALTIRP